MKPYLIVGLGNIGEAYTYTRHNIGFLIVNHLAAAHQATFRSKYLGMVTSFEDLTSNQNIYLLKPSTYMNNSGRAIKYWVNQLNVSLENLLVIVDDLHLPFGHLRLKQKGSHAGHNGLKNTAEQLQTTHYNRLRFGIGNDFLAGEQSNFVLNKFTKQEQKQLAIFIQKASNIILHFCQFGMLQTMNTYNKKSLS